MTQSIGRPLCDSWASCISYNIHWHKRTSGDHWSSAASCIEGGHCTSYKIATL